MGKSSVELRDYGDDMKKEDQQKQTTTKDTVGLWNAPISVWSDIQITKDNDPGCTGYYKVTVTINPTVDGRDGNKVKCRLMMFQFESLKLIVASIVIPSFVAKQYLPHDHQLLTLSAHVDAPLLKARPNTTLARPISI